MKRTIQYLIATATLFSGMTQAALVSHYAFDETSGTTAADTGPAAANGTIGSNVTLGTPGKFGTAFTFKNDATQNGIVDMGNAATFPPLITSQQATVSVWLKFSPGGGTRDSAVFLGNNAGANRYLDVGTASTGEIYARTRDTANSGDAFPNLLGGSVLSDDTWHHVAYTANAATETTQLYIDGVLVGSTTAPAFTFPAFNNLEIGRLGRSSPTDAYAGAVDELRIYDNVLSATEIAGLAGLPVADPALQVNATSSFVSQGLQETFSISFSNAGATQNLVLAGAAPITISGPDAANFSVVSYDNNLLPGASGTIGIGFNPTDGGGTYSATISIASNDSLHPSKDVTIDVEVQDPTAAVAPGALDFGAYDTVSEPQSRTISITNTGANLPLTVDSLSLSGSPAFSVDEELPITVPAGQSKEITVRFDPAGEDGNFTGNLVIYTDAYTGNLFNIPISASVKLADPDASLVSHFTFDEEASLGDDSGTFDNDGTAVGNAQWTSASRIGSGALLLDGSGARIDLGVESGPDYTAALLNDYDGFTMTCWALVPTGTASDRTRFFSSYANGASLFTEGWGVGRRNASATLAAAAYGKVDYLTATGSAPGAGAWHHYAYIFRNVPVNRVDFYIDGTPAGSISGEPAGVNDATTVGFAIGALGKAGAVEGFDGRIDDLRIYDRELAARNILDLYNSAPALSAYASWAGQYGLDPESTGAPLADPDNDGISNSIEFVLGSNPVSGLASNLPVVVRENGNLVITYNRKKSAASDGFIAQVEYSETLAADDWTTALSGVDGVTISTTDTTDIDTETETVTTSIPATNSKMFARVKVIAP